MDAEVTIIGAGVIGLSVSAALSGCKGPVFVIDRNLSFGQETSSRNSEVYIPGYTILLDPLKGNCARKERRRYMTIVTKMISHTGNVEN